jgi:hypothetical protein
MIQLSQLNPIKIGLGKSIFGINKHNIQIVANKQ